MRLMPVTSYLKSHQSNKCPASVTSAGFKVLPQHEPQVFRGHRYHCHCELSLPRYFWPAVYNPSALSSQLSLYIGYSSVQIGTNVSNLFYRQWSDIPTAALTRAPDTSSRPSDASMTSAPLATLQREIIAVDINEK